MGGSSRNSIGAPRLGASGAVDSGPSLSAPATGRAATIASEQTARHANRGMGEPVDFTVTSGRHCTRSILGRPTPPPPRSGEQVKTTGTSGKCGWGSPVPVPCPKFSGSDSIQGQRQRTASRDSDQSSAAVSVASAAKHMTTSGSFKGWSGPWPAHVKGKPAQGSGATHHNLPCSLHGVHLSGGRAGAFNFQLSTFNFQPLPSHPPPKKNSPDDRNIWLSDCVVIS